MAGILKFIAETFDLHVLSLFFISSIFLLLLDARKYKEKALKKEYKFTRFFGFFYIGFGLIMYVFARFIKM